MSITLNQLIDQVREELLIPRQATTPEAVYPFLFVDEVELELAVTVSDKVDGSGKVTIHIAEIGSGAEKGHEQAQRMKIKMTPLLSKDEMRERLKQDKRLWGKIEDVSAPAITKDGGIVGRE